MPGDNDGLNTNTSGQSLNQLEENSQLSLANLASLNANSFSTEGEDMQAQDLGLDQLAEINAPTSVEDYLAIGENLADYGILPSLPEYDISNTSPLVGLDKQSWATNWWNDFLISANEVEADTERGRQLEFEEKILEQEVKKKAIMDDPNLTLEQKEQALFEIADAQATIWMNEDYVKAREGEREDMGDIASYRVDDEYAIKKHKFTAEENSSFWNYLAYESAGDLGGSYADLSTMIASFASFEGILALGNMAAATVAEGFSAGGATPWLIQAGAWVGAIGTSAYFTMKGRENETYAEMAEAYRQRVDQETKSFIQKNGRAPFDSELAQIKLDAHEGLAQLKAQNMMLSSGDILQTAMLALPWTKALRWGGRFGRGASYSTFAGRMGMRTLNQIYASASEGMEETSQYMFQKHFINGLYKDDYTFGEMMSEFANTTKNSLTYTIADTTDEGFEHDAEFRNAWRSGAIMGGGMHAISNTTRTFRDFKMRRLEKKDLQGLRGLDIANYKSLHRADALYSRLTSDGRLDTHIEVLENMKKLPDVDNKIIDFEIARAKDAQNTYMEIKKKHPWIGNRTLKQLKGNQDFKDLFVRMQTLKDIQQDAKVELKERKKNTSDILGKYSDDPSIKSMAITEKLARKDAIDAWLHGFKEEATNQANGQVAGKANQALITELEKRSETLGKELSDDITRYNEINNTKLTEKAFDTPFSEEIMESMYNELDADMTLVGSYADLQQMKTKQAQEKFLNQKKEARNRDAAQKKEEKAKAKAEKRKAKAGKEAGKTTEQTETGKETTYDKDGTPFATAPDAAPNTVPNQFYAGVKNGNKYGYKKKEDGNWYSFSDDPSVKDKLVNGTRDRTPEQIVGEAFLGRDLDDKGQAEPSASALADVLKESYGQAGIDVTPEGEALLKKDARKINEGPKEGQPIQDLSEFDTQEAQAEEKANQLYNEVNGADRMAEQSEDSTEVQFEDGKKVVIQKVEQPREEDTTVARSRKREEKSASGEKRNQAAKDRGTVITSIEMIKTDNKKSGADQYLEPDPTVQHQDEFNFLPLIESGRIKKGSTVHLELGPYNNGKITKNKEGKYKGQVYIYETDAQGNRTGSKPVTQLRFNFDNKTWSNATQSKAATEAVFEHFLNGGGPLKMKVSEKLPGNVVNVKATEENAQNAELERIANVRNVAEQSPWFLWGGKVQYGISNDRNILDTNDIDNNQAFNGTEETGKVIKNVKIGSTFLLAKDGNGNPMVSKAINRKIHPTVIKNALANLRALKDADERKRYFTDVVAKMMYLDSKPRVARAANLSLKGDLGFFMNFSAEGKASAKMDEEQFIKFMGDQTYGTDRQLINTQGQNFVNGVNGEGYSVPLTPLFQNVRIQSYNDYMMDVATYTDIKPDFPIHGTQLYLEPLTSASNEVNLPNKTIGEQEAAPQGYVPVEDQLQDLSDIVKPIEEAQKLGIEPEYTPGDYAKVKELAKQTAAGNQPKTPEALQLLTNYPKLFEKEVNAIAKTTKKRPRRGDGSSFTPGEQGNKKFSIKDGATRKWNKAKELAWLKTNFPQIPTEEFNEYTDALKKQMPGLQGYYSNAMIYLSENAAEGTAYHEAFHAVMDLFLSDKQKAKLYDEASKRFNMDRKEEAALEEAMAKLFEVQKVRGQVADLSGSPALKRFFQKIMFWVKERLGLLGIDEVFANMDAQGYAKRTPSQRIQNQTIRRRLIPELTPAQQRQRVNSMTFDFFQILQESQGVSKVADINPDKVTNGVIKEAFDKIYNWYADKEDALDANDPLKATTESILDNFHLLEEQAKQHIRSFGYKINTTQEAQEEQQESGEQKIYGKPAYEESAKKSLSREIKLYLSTIKRGDVDEYGRSQYHDFNDVYSILAQRMANASSLDEMINRLKALSTGNDAMAKVLADLEGSKPTDKGGVKFDNFSSKFFATFSTNYANFLTINKSEFESVNHQASEAAGTIVNDARNFYNIIDSNSASQSKYIREAWRENIKGIEGKKLKNVASAYSQAQMLYDEGKYPEFSKATSAILKKLGISISPEAINESLLIESPSFVHNLYVSRYGIPALLNAAEQGRKLLSVTQEEAQQGVEGIGEESTINKLAVLESLSRSNPTGDAFKKSGGNTIHPIGMHNGLTAKVQELKDLQYTTALRKEAGLQNNQILKLLAETKGRDALQFAYFGEEYDRNKKNGTDFDRVVEAQINRTKLNAFLNGGKEMAWFTIPALGDKGTSGFIRLNKTLRAGGNKVENFPRPFLPGSEGLNPDLVARFAMLAKDEFMRIHKETNLLYQIKPEDRIKQYHFTKDPNKADGNAFSFQLFPQLNNILADADLTEDADLVWESILPQVSAELEAFIKNEINEEIKYLQEIGLLRANTEGVFPTSVDKTNMYYVNSATVDYNALREYGQDENQKIKNAVAHYVTSNFLFNAEFTPLIGGDIALYKGKKDASKRYSSIGTPGTSLYTGLGGARPNYTMGVLADNFSDRSELVKVYRDFLTAKDGLGLDPNEPIVKRILEAYEKPNQTDAQGFISLDRYKEILVGQGQWNDTLQGEYENLKAGRPTTGTVILQPIKGIYSGTRNDGARETYDLIKYSSFPLIPAYTAKNPALQKLANKMEELGLDEVVFDSAYKVGQRGVAQDIDGLTPITLPNSNWRIPQVVPEKQQDSANMGSQMRKLIFSNIPEGSTLQVKKDAGQALLNRLLDIGLTKALGTLDSKEKIAQIIREQIGERDLTELYEEAAELDAAGNFKMPISFPLVSRRIESIINSYVRKTITKSKMPGLQAVQVSSYGVSKEGIGFDTDLKDVSFKKVNGKWEVQPAEVMLSPEYFIKTFKKKGYDASILFDEDGNFKEEAIPEEMRRVVLYRIPTQGKNSMMPVRIKGFLPKESGSSIVMPAFTTAIAGSDFDIDKVFVEMHNFNVKEGKIDKVKYSTKADIIPKLEQRQIQNALLDIHYDILTSPEMALEMITPLDGVTIDKVVTEVEEAFQAQGEGSWASSRYQSDAVMKNQAGKNLVGVFALHTTFHAIAQDIGLVGPSLIFKNDVDELTPKDKKDLELGKDPFASETSLAMIENNEDGSLISDNFNESLNAAVDNAKDPKLGPINVNEFTATVDALMTHYGHFKAAKYLLNQHIIRDLSKAYFKNSVGTSRAKALEQAKLEVMHRYGIEGLNDIKLNLTRNLDLTSLKSRMDEKYKEDTEHQKAVLEAFLALNELGEDLNSMITGMNSDTTGVASTMQGNLIKRKKFKDGVLQNPSFTFNEKKFNEHSISKYHENGVVAPTKALEKNFIWNTPGMNVLQGVVENSLNKVVNEKELTSLQYNYYSYLYTTNTKIGDAVASKSKSLMTTGDKSFASRVKTFQEVERRWEKEYGYRPSTFFQGLLIRKDVDGIDLVEFNNTAADSRDKLTKDTMTFEIEQLYNGNTLPANIPANERKAATNLMRDLVPYAFMTGGFNKSLYSFIDYIPTAIWKAEYDVVADHQKMMGKLTEVSDNQASVFLRQYVQNHPDSTILKNYKVTKMDNGYFFAPAKDRFIRNTEGRIFEQVNENIFKEIPVIGRGQALQEYAAGKTFTESQFPRPVKVTQAEALKGLNFGPAPTGTQVQEQRDSSLEPDLLEDVDRKIVLMKELFKEQGVEVDVVVNSDIDANAQIEYRPGQAPLIKIKNAFKDTVFHEFGHLYIDLLGDSHTLVQKAIGQLRNSELYNEVKANYSQLTDKELDMEVLATAIGREGATIFDNMKKANWWDRFVNLILDAVNKLIPGLTRSAAQELARNMLTGQTNQLKVENIIKSNKIQRQVAEEAGPEKKNITRLDNLREEMVDVFLKKAAIFKHKSKLSDYSQNMEKLADRLSIIDAKKAVLLFSVKAFREIDTAHKKINALLESGQFTEKELYQFKDYISGYNILDEIPTALRREGIEISDAARQRLNDARGLRDDIINIYHAELPKIISRRLAKFTNQHTAEELEAYFSKVTGDISYAEAIATFMGDSKDPVLSLLAKMTDESMQNVREAHMDFANELHDKVRALEKSSAGKKDLTIYGFMLEKDSKGNLTGHYISEHKHSEWQAKKKVAFEKIEKEFGEDRERIMHAMRVWHNANSIWDKTQGKYLPNDMYLNPEFSKIRAEINSGSAKGQFYEWFTKAYSEMQDKLPSRHQRGTLLPVMRKSKAQRLSQQVRGVKSAYKASKEGIKDTFVAREDDINKGLITNEAGTPLDSVPIFYTAENVEVADRIFNLEELLDKFSFMAMEYEAKSDLIDTMEGAKELIKERKVIKVNSKGEKALNAVKQLFNREVAEKTGANSNAMKQLEGFMKIMYYGQHDIDQGSIGKFDVQKTAKAFRQVTSMQGMAFNFIANVTNVNMGETMNLAEAFAGEHYTAKQWGWAHGIWTANAAGIAADLYNRKKKNKISIVSDRLDILGEYRRDLSNPKNTVLKRFSSLRPAYLLQDLGEKMMQQTVMMAILKNTPAFDKNGNKVGNAWDAIDTSDGTVKFKEGVEVDMNAVGRKINAVIRRMHGNYNENTPIAMQRHALGKLALQFRKWVVPGMMRRYEGTRYNEFLETETRGSYRDFWKVQVGMLKDLGRLRFAMMSENWSQLSKREKANYWRAVSEIGFYTTSLLVMSLFLSDDDGDSEEGWWNKFFFYQAKRYQQEMTFYMNPSSFLDILKSPVAAAGTVENMIGFLSQAGSDSWSLMTGGDAERYKAGHRKGNLKIKRKFDKFFPLAKQIERLNEDGLDEQLKFYNIKK